MRARLPQSCKQHRQRLVTALHNSGKNPTSTPNMSREEIKEFGWAVYRAKAWSAAPEEVAEAWSTVGEELHSEELLFVKNGHHIRRTFDLIDVPL